MKKNIYLDNNSTTEIDSRVVDQIILEFKRGPSNPSSAHSLGRQSKARLSEFRQTIAACLSARPQEIIFTSGGTEGLNTCIRGIAGLAGKGHIITSSAEHSSVYQTIKDLEIFGYKTTFINPGLRGAPTPDQLAGEIKSDTILIALMAVNNETGVKTDIKTIAAIAEERRIPLIVDGVALLGKDLFDITPGISAMCFSGHKFHGPKGIGFTYLKAGTRLKSLLTGGSQEFGRRAGTEPLPLIAGLAEAVKLAFQEGPQAIERMAKLKDLFETSILEIPGTLINGEGPRVSNTSNISFSGREGEMLLAALDLKGIAASHGSACSSGALEPSRILLNMGIPIERARASLRFSFSRFTTEEEVMEAVKIIKSLF